jgi:hypothetical protein
MVARRWPSQHGRNWSNISDQSAVSQDNQSLPPAPIAELDAGRDGDRRSSLQRALQGFGMGRIMSKSRGDPIVLTGGSTRHDNDDDRSFNSRALALHILRKEIEDSGLVELPANSITKPTCSKPLGKFATMEGDWCGGSFKLPPIKDDKPKYPQNITLKKPKLKVIIPKPSEKQGNILSEAYYPRKRSPPPMPETGERGKTEYTPSITRGSSLSPTPPTEIKIMAKVLYDFKGVDISELVVKKSEVIEIIQKESKG